MSDEYKRVLYAWAAHFVPAGATVTDVRLHYDDGYDPTFTDHEASLTATIGYKDADYGLTCRDLDPSDVGTMGELLTELFKLAAAKDAARATM